MPAHQAVASLRGSGTSVVLELEPGRLLAGRRGARSTPTDDPVGFVRGQRPAGVIATSRGVDVAAVAGLLDAAHSESPGCVAWHAPIPEPPASGPAPAVPAARPLPPKSDVVSVLPWILPLIGEGPCSTAGRSGGGVGLAAGGPTILGTLDEQEIRSVVDSHRSALRTCQRSGLARGLGAAEVTVKFVVATSGAVSSARIRRSTLGDERVEDCIRERFGRMQFPPPPGGGITIVHWPLELGR
jgi:TonB family protein